VEVLQHEVGLFTVKTVGVERGGVEYVVDGRSARFVRGRRGGRHMLLPSTRDAFRE